MAEVVSTDELVADSIVETRSPAAFHRTTATPRKPRAMTRRSVVPKPTWPITHEAAKNSATMTMKIATAERENIDPKSTVAEALPDWQAYPQGVPTAAETACS